MTSGIENLSESDWDDILGHVYDAALTPDAWGNVLLALGRPLNAHGGQLVVMANDVSNFYENLFVGVDTERGLREFGELVHDGLHIRANAVMSVRELATISDYSHTSEAQINRHPFYQDHAIILVLESTATARF